MTLTKGKYWGVFYLIILLADVTGLVFNFEMLHKGLKPLLMPVLLILLILNIPISQRPFGKLVFIALIFSWLGDLFLMMEPYYPIFFIFGLSAFLIAHIFYIVFFKNLGSAIALPWNKSFLKFLLVSSYGVILVYGLWPYLGALKLPVLLYAATLSIMVIMSLKIDSTIPGNIRAWFGLGAFLFLISDSILALNKFVYTSYIGSGGVMLTYGLAQLFIVFGTVQLCLEKLGANEVPAE